MVKHTVKDYATELRESFDYQAYANLMYGLGKQCNGRKDRFDKSDFVEKSLEEFSDGRLKWVDEEGYDNVDTKYDHKLEVKYMQDSLYIKDKETLKYKTGVYKIKNNLGSSFATIQDPADYYLFFQQNAMAILLGTQINSYTKPMKDGIGAQIPIHLLSFVFTPSDIEIKNTIPFSYKKQKDDMQRNIIRSMIMNHL